MWKLLQGKRTQTQPAWHRPSVNKASQWYPRIVFGWDLLVENTKLFLGLPRPRWTRSNWTWLVITSSDSWDEDFGWLNDKRDIYLIRKSILGYAGGKRGFYKSLVKVTHETGGKTTCTRIIYGCAILCVLLGNSEV